jgi:hypothetical protein
VAVTAEEVAADNCETGADGSQQLHEVDQHPGLVALSSSPPLHLRQLLLRRDQLQQVGDVRPHDIAQQVDLLADERPLRTGRRCWGGAATGRLTPRLGLLSGLITFKLFSLIFFNEGGNTLEEVGQEVLEGVAVSTATVLDDDVEEHAEFKHAFAAHFAFAHGGEVVGDGLLTHQFVLRQRVEVIEGRLQETARCSRVDFG